MTASPRCEAGFRYCHISKGGCWQSHVCKKETLDHDKWPGACCSRGVPQSSPRRSQFEPGIRRARAFRTKRLRRFPEIEMFKWNSISNQIRAETESVKPKRDRMRLARYYQSLLDSGEVSTRAELARHLGVSRARVTQVLNRLQQPVAESCENVGCNRSRNFG